MTLSDLLGALNTGHEGGCGTLHANTATDVPPRLEALACAAGLSREAVHSQIAAALDAVIHLTRDHADGRRRVAEICMMSRRPSGLVTAEPALTFSRDGRATTGPGFPALVARAPGVPLPPVSPAVRYEPPAPFSPLSSGGGGPLPGDHASPGRAHDPPGGLIDRW